MLMLASLQSEHIFTGFEAVCFALGVILIIISLIQKKKDDGGISALSGGNQELFVESKERGLDRILSILMINFGLALFVMGFILNILQNVLK